MHVFDRSSALVIVDVQNDFADPAGSLSVAGGASIIPRINATAAAVRAAGGLVAYTADWHPAHTPHFAPDGGIWPVHCVGSTWGAEFHPALEVDGPIVRKGANGEDGYSGFTMRDPATGATVETELCAILRGAGVRRVAVCGLATDYCVQATALDAVRLGFETTVFLDAIRAVDLSPGDGRQALEAMAAAGVELADAGSGRVGGDA